SASVAEGQAAGSSKGSGVPEERSEARIACISNSAKRVANEVRVRAESSAVGNAGVVAGHASGASVSNRKWRPGLNAGNARPLPASQQSVGHASASGERQIVHVADCQHVALVKVGACS